MPYFFRSSGNVVTFTVWNEMATNFPLQTLNQLEQPIIIAVSSCWARRFAGNYYLGATDTITNVQPLILAASYKNRRTPVISNSCHQLLSESACGRSRTYPPSVSTKSAFFYPCAIILTYYTYYLHDQVWGNDAPTATPAASRPTTGTPSTPTAKAIDTTEYSYASKPRKLCGMFYINIVETIITKTITTYFYW